MKQEELMDVKEIREAIEGLLNAANRNVGGMAPGVIASWCRKALALIDAPVLEEHDLYVYDDAKPVASDARELARKVYDNYGHNDNNAAELIESFAADRERKAVDQFWKELHEEAEVHLDKRIDALGKIETYKDASIRNTMLDGWYVWLLAKRIVSERNKCAAILQAEPGQEKGSSI